FLHFSVERVEQFPEKSTHYNAFGKKSHLSFFGVGYMMKEASGISMKNDVIEVKVKGIIPTSRGCAVFLGNDDKIFTIYVDHSVGQAIAMFIQDTPKERPLTHDLIASIFVGLGVRVNHIVVNE